MDAALDRRKRLKAMAEGATDVNVEEQGQSKLSNPLVDGPLQGKDAPSFSFYSDPLAAFKPGPQASLGQRRGAPRQPRPRVPSGEAQPIQRPPGGPYIPPGPAGALPARPMHLDAPPGLPGMPPHFMAPGLRPGPPQWPLPMRGPPPPRPPPYAPGQRPPPRPSPQRGGGGGRGGRYGGQAGSGPQGGHQQQGGRGRGANKHGRSGGNDCVEAYYHPNMVEDPWRALQGRMDAQQPKQLQLQLQQQQQQPQQPQQPVPPVSAEEAGAAPSSKAPPANMSGLFDEVLLDVTGQDEERSALHGEGAADRPWH